VSDTAASAVKISSAAACSSPRGWVCTHQSRFAAWKHWKLPVITTTRWCNSSCRCAAAGGHQPLTDGAGAQGASHQCLWNNSLPSWPRPHLPGDFNLCTHAAPTTGVSHHRTWLSSDHPQTCCHACFHGMLCSCCSTGTMPVQHPSLTHSILL